MTDTKSVYNDIKRLIDQAMRSLIDHDLPNQLSQGTNMTGNQNIHQSYNHGQGNVLSNSSQYDAMLGSISISSVSNRSKSNQTSALKRQLDAKAKSSRYIQFFRLPKDELLDGFVPCSLWLTYNKEVVAGTLYLSQNYACFSDGKDGVAVVIPLRNIALVEKGDSGYLPKVSRVL